MNALLLTHLQDQAPQPELGIRMFCQGCGYSELVNASSATLTQCPRCYSTVFASKEPKCAVNF